MNQDVVVSSEPPKWFWLRIIALIVAWCLYQFIALIEMTFGLGFGPMASARVLGVFLVFVIVPATVLFIVAIKVLEKRFSMRTAVISSIFFTVASPILWIMLPLIWEVLVAV